MTKTEKMFRYAMDCIRESSDFEYEFDEDVEMSDGEVLDWFFKDFRRCNDYAYERQRTPNRITRLSDYIQNAPSTIDYPTSVSAWWEVLQDMGWENEDVKYDFTTIMASVLWEAYDFLCVDLTDYCD